MYEKGDDAIGMDDSPEEENESQGISGEDERMAEQEESAHEEPQAKGNTEHGRAIDTDNLHEPVHMAAVDDKPAQKASLKEKLEAFKARAGGTGADKTMPQKAKEKTETL